MLNGSMTMKTNADKMTRALPAGRRARALWRAGMALALCAAAACTGEKVEEVLSDRGQAASSEDGTVFTAAGGASGQNLQDLGETPEETPAVTGGQPASTPVVMPGQPPGIDDLGAPPPPVDLEGPTPDTSCPDVSTVGPGAPTPGREYLFRARIPTPSGYCGIAGGNGVSFAVLDENGAEIWRPGPADPGVATCPNFAPRMSSDGIGEVFFPPERPPEVVARLWDGRRRPRFVCADGVRSCQILNPAGGDYQAPDDDRQLTLRVCGTQGRLDVASETCVQKEVVCVDQPFVYADGGNSRLSVRLPPAKDTSWTLVSSQGDCPADPEALPFNCVPSTTCVYESGCETWRATCECPVSSGAPGAPIAPGLAPVLPGGEDQGGSGCQTASLVGLAQGADELSCGSTDVDWGPHQAVVVATPAVAAFGKAREQNIRIEFENISVVPTGDLSVTISGPDASAFTLVSSGCSFSRSEGTTCIVVVGMQSGAAPGPKSATLNLQGQNTNQSVPLTAD